MTSTEVETRTLPSGTYSVDRVHSTVAFEVEYMGVGTFGGDVTDFDASLVDGRLSGAARIATLEVKDENLHAHLLSPEFFDAERYPEVSLHGRDGRARGPRGQVRGRDLDQGRDAAGDADGHDRRPGRRSVRQRALRARAEDDGRPHRVRDHLERRDAGRQQGAFRRGDAEGRPSRSSRRPSDADPRHLGQPAPRLAQHVAASRRRRAAWPGGRRWSSGEGLREVPPYDQDDDLGPAPAAVASLRDAVASADAVLIATPEYNHSIPGALKNALDWASRPFATNVFRGKPVAVIGASAGLFGAVWAQAELRKVLGSDGGPRRRRRAPGGAGGREVRRRRPAPRRRRSAIGSARRSRHSRPSSSYGSSPPERTGRLLGVVLGRRLVLGEPPLNRRPREDADEPAPVDDRDALVVAAPRGRLKAWPRAACRSRRSRSAARRSRAAASCGGRGHARRPPARASSA